MVLITIDKMRHVLTNIAPNLCCGGLQDVGGAKHLKVVLTKDEIIYHKNVGDAKPSMSVSDPSTSWGDIDVNPYTNTTYPLSN
jgi:hypothetical protein